jgi:hypothetical protein
MAWPLGVAVVLFALKLICLALAVMDQWKE